MTTPQSIRPLVLVADDDEDILTLVTFSLRRDGYEVVQARDGAEALELARERRPAALVLDVMMPKASGFDVTRALRAEGNDVPILLLTASVQERHRARGLAAGASDFVRKPFSPRELLERVARLFGAREEATFA